MKVPWILAGIYLFMYVSGFLGLFAGGTNIGAPISVPSAGGFVVGFIIIGLAMPGILIGAVIIGDPEISLLPLILGGISGTVLSFLIGWGIEYLYMRWSN
jgi:hypothetical protein